MFEEKEGFRKTHQLMDPLRHNKLDKLSAEGQSLFHVVCIYSMVKDHNRLTR